VNDSIHSPRRAAGSRAARRWTLLPLLATLLAAAACGGAGDAAEEPGTAAPGAAPAEPAHAGDGADPAAAPPPGLSQPSPLEIARDSMEEAELYRRRQQSMESFASCMQKAKDLEPAQRQMIEAACKRLPTAPR
jgi:hypothetical protein